MVSIFIFSLAGKNHALDKYDTYLVRAAIFFALFADLFLILNESYEIYVIGIVSFSVCQLMHFWRFTDAKTFVKALVALPVVFVIFPRGFDIVVRFSVIYIVCYLFAAAGAVRAYMIKKYDSPNRQMIVAAMLMYLISDINVLLYNSPRLFGYREIFLFLIWIFCLPAHILLSLSKIKLR